MKRSSLPVSASAFNGYRIITGQSRHVFDEAAFIAIDRQGFVCLAAPGVE